MRAKAFLQESIHSARQGLQLRGQFAVVFVAVLYGIVLLASAGLLTLGYLIDDSSSITTYLATWFSVHATLCMPLFYFLGSSGAEREAQQRLAPIEQSLTTPNRVPALDNTSLLSALDLRNKNLSTLLIHHPANISPSILHLTDTKNTLFLKSLWKEGAPNNPYQPITRDLLRRLGATNADKAITNIEELTELLKERGNSIPAASLQQWQTDLARFRQELQNPEFIRQNPHLQNAAKDITDAHTLVSDLIYQEIPRQQASAYMLSHLEKIKPAVETGGVTRSAQHGAMQFLSLLPREIQLHTLGYVNGNRRSPSNEIIAAHVQDRLPHEHFIDVARGRLTFEKQLDNSFKPVSLNGKPLPTDWQKKVAAQEARGEAAKKTV